MKKVLSILLFIFRLHSPIFVNTGVVAVKQFASHCVYISGVGAIC